MSQIQYQRLSICFLHLAEDLVGGHFLDRSKNFGVLYLAVMCARMDDSIPKFQVFVKFGLSCKLSESQKQFYCVFIGKLFSTLFKLTKLCG